MPSQLTQHTTLGPSDACERLLLGTERVYTGHPGSIINSTHFHYPVPLPEQSVVWSLLMMPYRLNSCPGLIFYPFIITWLQLHWFPCFSSVPQGPHFLYPKNASLSYLQGPLALFIKASAQISEAFPDHSIYNGILSTPRPSFSLHILPFDILSVHVYKHSLLPIHFYMPSTW